MKKFPKLYKLTSSKKVQEWEIWVEENVIHQLYGLLDGKHQHITDTIAVGKNVGRSNETSPNKQAEAEAQSKWEHKHKKDYHLTIEKCEAQTVKIANEGGYLPMLAHKYTKQKKKIIWPALCQPKLDGLRCIARCIGGWVTLWFRSGKQIKTMQHIVDALTMVMLDGEIWDGELYTHNADFNKLGGSIRRDKNMDINEAKKVEYHVYDFPRIRTKKELLTESDDYFERHVYFQERKIKHPIVRVPTNAIFDEEKMLEQFAKYIDEDYEGIMIRNAKSPYEQKRSYNLLKYKEFNEDEFKIVGYEEGRGLLSGAVGAFVCALSDGRTFKAKLKGKDVTELLKEYFKNPKTFMGKQLTVQYQGLSKDGIPRFPVGKAIRFDK